MLVLHDINQASRYSHHLIAMRDGQIQAQGTPAEVITEEVIAGPFGINSLIIPDPVTSTPLCIPRTDLPNGAGDTASLRHRAPAAGEKAPGYVVSL